jgi:hypothetical protein
VTGLNVTIRCNPVANGKHRDSFATDILNHGIPTFSAEADDLIRRLSQLSSISAWQVTMDEVEQRLRDLPGERAGALGQPALGGPPRA